MAKKPAPPAPDLGALMSQYGVQASPSGNAYNDPDDLPVFLGSSPMKTGANTSTTSRLKKSFYNIDQAQLRDLQKRLWAGGLYPKGADPEDVILGIHDDLTYGAYSNLVDRAGSFYAAGKQHTPDDVLDMAAGIYDQINKSSGKGAGQGRGGGGGGGSAGPKRDPLTVELSNPEDIIAVAQRTAVSTLGRALTEAEANRFVQSFQGQQAAPQRQSYAMDETGGTVTAAPQAAVAAESFARGAAPVEAGANDFVKTYSAFARILGRKG